MKKVLLGLLVVVLFIGAGTFYLLDNIDSLVKTAIESAGSEAIGSQVSVDSVEINLSGGTAAIYGFSVANPRGFSDATMLSFSELSIDLDLGSMGSDVPRIFSIVARNPYLLYEFQDGVSNIDTVSENFAGDAENAPSSAAQDNESRIAIDEILVEDIQAALNSDILPTTVNVSLGTITLADLEGTPEEIAEQIAQPLISQISRVAASALLSAAGDLISGSVEEVIDNNLQGLADELSERRGAAVDQVENATQDLRDKVGNLFGN